MLRKMKKPTVLVFLLSVILSSVVTAQNSNKSIPVGVILDLDKLVTKMAQTSITMAVEDFYMLHSNYSTRLVLHTRDSQDDDVQAAVSALDLLQNMNIDVIIGPLKSSQAIIVSKVGNKSQVPVISFSATSPILNNMHVPYFIRTTINDAAQLNAITCLIKAYGWRQVVPIYEDTDFGWDIVPFLADALEEIDVRIPYRSIIPVPSTNDQIEKELYKLQTMQTRVFLVHMSFPTGSTLFFKAKEMGMMREGYVWIMTSGMTNMVNILNSSVTNAMAGALGVRLYVPNTVDLNNFIIRWRNRFHEDNPQDMYTEPSIYALRAYDTIYALAMAVEQAYTKFTNSTTLQPLSTLLNGSQLLKAISSAKFQGLGGKFELVNGELQFLAFEIINIVGWGSRRVGYWTKKGGLSKELDENNNKIYSSSKTDLNMVIWPGEPEVVPKGWEIPVNGRKLRVGVIESFFPQFIHSEIDPETNATWASGYAVDVFEAAVKRLPYAVSYEYKRFGDGYRASSITMDDFVYQVYLGNYDMIIGDITIRYNRTRYADFSMPYTESGVAMIVPVKKSENKSTLVFLRPLELGLWLVSAAFLIGTGITILILEPKIRKKIINSSSPISGYAGAIVHLSLFAYQEELESLLSKLVSIISVFVLLVLCSSYTANLSSILTLERLQPTVTSIQDLRLQGAYIGYSKSSFVKGLLEQLGFDKSKLKSVYPEDFATELDKGSANGGVAAIVHEIPYIKLFLPKHYNAYTMVPIFKTAGFGFAFPKGSPLVPEFSQAILNITDGDDMVNIEKKWIGDLSYQDSFTRLQSNSEQLKFVSFQALFGFSGVAYAVSLLIYAGISYSKKQRMMNLETETDNSTAAASHQGAGSDNPLLVEGDHHSGHNNGNTTDETNTVATRRDDDEILPADNQGGGGPVSPSSTENVSDPTP